MKEKNCLCGLSGFLIGATMMVPGVSGASMAMILGVYERLILAVSSFRKKPIHHALFLLIFSASALVGMFLFAGPLAWLLEYYPIPTMYFFGGAVFGGIPMICRKAEAHILEANSLIYILIGILVVLLFGMLPVDSGALQTGDDLRYQAKLVLLGIPAASALVLPGISLSHFLLILGLYGELIEAMQSMRFSFLIPLGIGIGLGIIIVTKALAYILKYHKKESYMMILGFVLGSALEIFPEISSLSAGVWAAGMGVLGFGSVHWVSRREIL